MAIVSAAFLAACDAGSPRDCSVLCSEETQCPDGLRCASDGYCYRADETPGTCSEDPVDASSFFDSAVDPVDAPGSDAEPDPDPDGPIDMADAAGPCPGLPSASGINATVVAIPSSDANGITSVIAIDDPCVEVTTVEVRLDITHPFRGDIDAFLTSPTGRTTQFLMSARDNRDDIHEVFSIFVTMGEPAIGDWVLRIVDNVIGDSGTLDRWSIGINEAAP